MGPLCFLLLLILSVAGRRVSRNDSIAAPETTPGHHVPVVCEDVDTLWIERERVGVCTIPKAGSTMLRAHILAYVKRMAGPAIADTAVTQDLLKVSTISFMNRGLLGSTGRAREFAGCIAGLEARRCNVHITLWDFIAHCGTQNRQTPLACTEPASWAKAPPTDWRLYIVTRNPYERLFSAWNDKINKHEYNGPLYTTYKGMDFNQFVAALANVRNFDATDKHLRQMSRFCNAVHTPFQVVHWDELHDFVSNELSFLGVDKARGGSVPMINHEAYEMTLCDAATPATLDTISRLYQEDLLRFGYPLVYNCSLPHSLKEVK